MKTHSHQQSHINESTAQNNYAEYLTFLLAGEEYGLDIMSVQEIQGWVEPNQIPHVPDYILGVINLRGEVIPLLDLRHRLSLSSEKNQPNSNTVIIVVKLSTGDTIGLVVDAMSEIYKIERQQLKPSPDLNNDENANFLTSIATIEEKLILLLDVDQLMNQSDYELCEFNRQQCKFASH